MCCRPATCHYPGFNPSADCMELTQTFHWIPKHYHQYKVTYRTLERDFPYFDWHFAGGSQCVPRLWPDLASWIFLLTVLGASHCSLPKDITNKVNQTYQRFVSNLFTRCKILYTLANHDTYVYRWLNSYLVYLWLFLLPELLKSYHVLLYLSCLSCVIQVFLCKLSTVKSKLDTTNTTVNLQSIYLKHHKSCEFPMLGYCVMF